MTSGSDQPILLGGVPRYQPPPTMHWVNIADEANIPLGSDVYCVDPDGVRHYLAAGPVFEQAGNWYMNITEPQVYWAWYFLSEHERTPNPPRGWCKDARQLWVQHLGP